MSPEMTKGGTFEFKNDIYMLGLTFYFMLTGKLPEIKTKNFFDNSINIIKKKDSMEIIPEVYSKDIKHFIDKLLTWEVDQRPSAKRAFAEAVSYYTIKYLGITSILASL
jgi:serine/threonine protein kinase